MKAVFFNNGISGDKSAQIKRVYSRDICASLMKLVEISNETYAAEDLDSPALLKAETVFSTWGMPELSDSEITRYLPELKVIFYAAGSVQSFARPFLNKGIRIVSAWAANAVPVAEYTLAQIILANKGYFLSSSVFSEQGYEQARQCSNEKFSGNLDCAVGIIGAGMIGKKVIEMIKSCGLRVRILVYDPFLPDESAEKMGVVKCSLEELFRESQTISNHLANNEQTKSMLDYKLFRLMKNNAAFINTGRGAQVVENDLVRALNEQPNRTALLDVTYPEPPETGHPFYSMKNVFLTSHIAGSIGNETYRMGEFMRDELLRYLNGEALLYEVTADMLSRMA